jgi:Uma2 family endonuclease
MILDPAPRELAALIQRRRKSGLHRLDEVWKGVLHIVPAPSGERAQVSQRLAELLGPPARTAGLTPAMGEFNLGASEDDFRVPDGGLHRTPPRGAWQTTAALVVEIVSPGDQTWEKLPFYAAHGVDELLIVDPQDRSVRWLGLQGEKYRDIARSGLSELGGAELADKLDWL